MSEANRPLPVAFARRRRRWRAMLRPRAGRRLPAELRPARAFAAGEALADGVRDPGFELLLRRIDESPLHAGDRLELFFQGEDAIAAMLAAIEGARSEVLVEFYILRDDWTGRAFAGALIAAA